MFVNNTEPPTLTARSRDSFNRKAIVRWPQIRSGDLSLFVSRSNSLTRGVMLARSHAHALSKRKHHLIG